MPRGLELAIENRTPDVGVTVILDGHVFRELAPGDAVHVRLDDRRATLATLSESTFLRRYRDIFGP